MFKERVRLVTLTHKESGEKIKVNPKKVKFLSPAEGGGTEVVFQPDLVRVVTEDMLDVEVKFNYCHSDIKK